MEQEAREVAAEYPNVAFLMGSSFLHDAAANPNLAVFDNYIQDAAYLTGIVAGSMTQTGNIGMVGGFPIPEVNRLMHAFMAGVRETRPDAPSRSASSGRGSTHEGKRDRVRDDRGRGRHDVCRTLWRVGRGQGTRRLAIGNVIDTHPTIRDRSRVGAVAFRADDGRRHRQREGRNLRGRQLRRLQLHEEWWLLALAARHLRGQGARCRHGTCCRTAGRDP